MKDLSSVSNWNFHIIYFFSLFYLNFFLHYFQDLSHETCTFCNLFCGGQGNMHPRLTLWLNKAYFKGLRLFHVLILRVLIHYSYFFSGPAPTFHFLCVSLLFLLFFFFFLLLFSVSFANSYAWQDGGGQKLQASPGRMVIFLFFPSIFFSQARTIYNTKCIKWATEHFEKLFIKWLFLPCCSSRDKNS